MSPLIHCQNIGHAIAGKQLFEGLSLSIFSGERIGLIGPNGSGKSTLLRLIAGIDEPSTGQVTRRRGLRLSFVAQDPQFDSTLSVQEVLLQAQEQAPIPQHEKEVAVASCLSKLGFEDPQQSVKVLSGGWLKRLAIAHALVTDPDLLLLDEPTNHLDLMSILWLEGFLRRQQLSYIVISHDRVFLDRVAKRVIELNPCFPDGVFSVDGAYTQFMQKRDRFVEGLLESQRALSGKVRRELDWLRTSPKARTTKSVSRIKQAHAMMDELGDMQRRHTRKSVEIDFQGTERQTRQLVRANRLCRHFGQRVLFEGLSFNLSPGTVLGLLGPNGSGKTSLLKIISKQSKPDSGTIKYADDLNIVYFDQKREHLDPNASIKDTLSPAGDFVSYRGQRIHVAGWAQRFLFPRERLEQAIKSLSGGEQARLLISRLMLLEADVLILDEPTNDLDIDTLITLQESLSDFPGAVVLVTHDRGLMDAVATEIIALDGEGGHQIFADTLQWERSLTPKPEKPKAKVTSAPVKAEASQKKLSYLEKKELEGMEEAIAASEAKIDKLAALTEDPDIAANAEKLQAACEVLEKARQDCEALYERWEELEERSQS